jgi:hypothetical protein
MLELRNPGQETPQEVASTSNWSTVHFDIEFSRLRTEIEIECAEVGQYVMDDRLDIWRKVESLIRETSPPEDDFEMFREGSGLA